MDISFESKVAKSAPGYEKFCITIRTSIDAVAGTTLQQQLLDLPNGDRVRVTVEHLQAPSPASSQVHGDPVISGVQAWTPGAWIIHDTATGEEG